MKKSNRFKEHVLLVVIGVILFWGLFNYEKIFGLLGAGVKILSPFLIGAIIALIINVPMSAIERTLFKPDSNNEYSKIVGKIKRPISLFLSFLICVGVIVLVLYLIIPELITTFIQLSEDIPVFVKKISDQLQNSEQLNKWLETMNINKDIIIKKVQNFFNDGVLILKTVNSTVSAASSLIGNLINFVIGIFFAFYMLFQKEKLKTQLYKMTIAFFPEKIAMHLCNVCNISKYTFSKFLSGQCTEAVILGSLCCIGMSILRFPNAVTIGILVAVTAFIPIVGAFIGVAVGAFLIMVTDFKQAFWFVVFMIILQQIEGNIIYPKVVGQSVGLPSLWVLFAVTVGGAVGGIIGMFVSVPICSVVYTLLREFVQYLHQKRGISIEDEEAKCNCNINSSQKPDVVVVSHKETSIDKIIKNDTKQNKSDNWSNIFSNKKPKK